MIAVIFEMHPHEGQADRYFELAAQLRVELDLIDGFISIERFQSLSDSKKVLSLSYWRDEDAVKRWREMQAHLNAQALGKAEIFQRFRIRVANVLRDYGTRE